MNQAVILKYHCLKPTVTNLIFDIYNALIERMLLQVTLLRNSESATVVSVE